jgi:hypothetical protein
MGIGVRDWGWGIGGKSLNISSALHEERGTVSQW